MANEDYYYLYIDIWWCQNAPMTSLNPQRCHYTLARNFDKNVDIIFTSAEVLLKVVNAEDRTCR